jgi:hypothetical protein
VFLCSSSSFQAVTLFCLSTPCFIQYAASYVTSQTASVLFPIVNHLLLQRIPSEYGARLCWWSGYTEHSFVAGYEELGFVR